MNNTVPLSSLVKRVKVGYVGTVDKYYCDSNVGIKIYRPTDISPLGFDDSNVRYITKEFYDKNKKSQIHYGDIVISRCGKDGIPVIYKSHEQAQILNAVIIEPDEKKMSSEAIQLFLRSPFAQKQISNLTSGSVQGVINTEMIASLQVSSEIDYSNIAKLISSIDSIITNNNNKCSCLESIEKLLYDYWFVQFDFPDEHGKPYKTSGGKMLLNNDLNKEIPANWIVEPLSKIIKEFDKSNVQVNGAKENGKYPFFTSGDAILYYDDYFVDGFNCFLNTGGNPGIKGFKGKCAYSTDTWCINCGEYSYMIYLFFKRIMPQFEQLFFAGSGLKHLQKNALKRQLVCLPDKSVISKFNKLMDTIWDKKTQCFIANNQLSALHDFLLPMLMNGQITINKNRK